MSADSDDAERRRAKSQDLDLVERVPALLSAEPYDKQALLQALSALRRQQDRTSPGAKDEQRLASLTEAVQEALATVRVEARKARVEQLVRRPPTVAAILWVLASGPCSRTELGDRIDVADPVISRALSKLKQADLVVSRVDSGDGRKRVLALSEAGALDAASLTTYGERPKVLKGVQNLHSRGLLAESLTAAVELRRRTCHHEDVLARLESIAGAAHEQQAIDIWLNAIDEILTTLRQSGSNETFNARLASLEQYCLPRSQQDSQTTSDLAIAALSYCEYQNGRRADATLDEQAEHLTAAFSIFGRLAADPSERLWRERQGRALVAIADNQRKRGDLLEAARTALAARDIFLALDDAYGLSRSHFLIGFCFRLLGEFEAAEAQLKQAHTLALERGYQAFVVDSTVQLGEVQRCLGELDEAREKLEWASGEAARLGLSTAQAFAESFLAAVAYEQGSYDEAHERLDNSLALFTEHHIEQGIALTKRRQARLLMANHPDVRSVKRAAKLIDAAKRKYTSLEIPAGLGACLIDQGEIALASGKRPAVAAQELVGLIGNLFCADTLKRDVWFASMLKDFASRAEHGALRKAARRFLASANQVDEDPTLLELIQLAQQIPATAAAAESPAAERSRGDVELTVERAVMAGEHRVKRGLSYAIAADSKIAADPGARKRRVRDPQRVKAKPERDALPVA